MNDIAIKVENLSKSYCIGQNEGYKTFRETIVDTLKYPFEKIKQFGKPISEKEMIWALNDISFEVKKGEVFGIIGRNGAGKTTILKILSKITEPTKGRVELRGRIGSLLEVGTGFHPELSGRENIYLYGAILGMKRAEIRKKFDEIVSFSEIEKFIDTPVKKYSSGMYMRLAFSVAAHVEPEILLVDEVLAVGDAVFQKKCISKMASVAQNGRTVLFISHNMPSVASLCKNAIILNEGKIVFSGSAEQSVSHYLSQSVENINNISLKDRHDRKGNGEIKLTDFYLEDEKKNRVNNILNGQTTRFVFAYISKSGLTVKNVELQFVVLDLFGKPVFQFGTRFTGQDFLQIAPKGRFVCEIKKFPLAPERYRVDVYVRVNSNPSDFILWASQIDVLDGDFYKSNYSVLKNESGFLVDGTISCEDIQ
jgi:homopolymeric O-antigen transport system ATP-binding protein